MGNIADFFFLFSILARKELIFLSHVFEILYGS